MEVEYKNEGSWNDSIVIIAETEKSFNLHASKPNFDHEVYVT